MARPGGLPYRQSGGRTAGVTRVAARRAHMMLVHSARSGNGVSTLSTWIAGAVNRGQKVLYELAPDEHPDAVLNSRRRGLGPDVVTSGQLEVLDAAGLRTECGG